MTPDCVNLVDENDAGRGFFALFKHIAHARCADADKHLNEVRAADGKEGNVRLARNGPRKKRFASARRPDHQDAFWNASAEFLKFLWIAQKLDELLHFILCFLDPGDIAKCDFVFVAGEHARFRFPEVKRTFSGHADLLAKQEIKHQQEKGDRQKTDHGLREHVRFGLDGGLNTGCRELLLQIVCESQIDRSSKWHLLGRCRTDSLADISAAQRLGGAAIFYHQHERIVFVVNDLLILEQLEEPVIRHVFDRLHSAAVKEHRHRDQTKSDYDEDNAAPIKIGFAPAVFIFSLRVAIELSHTKKQILQV